MEFVNKMKKENKLIMGIGHRVKSVSCHDNTLTYCGVCSSWRVKAVHLETDLCLYEMFHASNSYQ